MKVPKVWRPVSVALRFAIAALFIGLGTAGCQGFRDYAQTTWPDGLITGPFVQGDPLYLFFKALFPIFGPNEGPLRVTAAGSEPFVLIPKEAEETPVAPTCSSAGCAVINFLPTGVRRCSRGGDCDFISIPLSAGSIQYSPDGKTLMAAGGSSLVHVIENLPDLVPSALSRPRAVGPTTRTVVIPGSVQAFSTQAIAFDPITARAHVCTTTGISVLDPPYAVVAFTVPLGACAGVAVTPDGSLVAAVRLTNQVFFYPGPLVSGSVPEILSAAGPGQRLVGIAFARDGGKLITPALDTPDVFLVDPPYGSASTVKMVSFPGVTGGWKDVAVDPGNAFALAAGSPTPTAAADPSIPLGRFPFGEGDFSIQTLPGPRGAGAARFLEEPPCAAPPAPAVASRAAPREGTPRLAGALPLVAALLPLSRSVRVGCPATVFLTVINAGTETATGVSISPATVIPAGFLYQTTDSSNALTGTPNTPVDIGPGQAQSFVIAFTPTAPFPPTDVAFDIAGTNTAPVLVLPSVNTLKLAAAPARTGDAIALAVTASGILDIPGPAGAAAFAVASANVGLSAVLTVSGDTGGAAAAVTAAARAPRAILPLGITVCQTNTATGECLAPPAPSVTVPVAAGATPSFGFFVTAAGDAPFDPGNNRVFARFRDALGVERGSTSLAVRTQP